MPLTAMRPVRRGPNTSDRPAHGSMPMAGRKPMNHLGVRKMESIPHGQRPAPSSQSKTVGRAYAEKAAKTIFARYPNPKAGPEYLVELTNCLAEQPHWIVDR